MTPQTTHAWIDWRSPEHGAAKKAYSEAASRGAKDPGSDAVLLLARDHGREFHQALMEMAALARETLRRKPLAYLWETRRNFERLIKSLGIRDEEQRAWCRRRGFL